jgi:hypothetical protein
MTDLRYAGLWGGITEAADIAKQRGITCEEAYRINQRKARRAHKPKPPPPESKVISMAAFVRKKAEKTIGAL